MDLDHRATWIYDKRTVTAQLQEVYEHILNDRRPEAIGATEKLAEQLDIKIKRSDQFPGRARR